MLAGKDYICREKSKSNPVPVVKSTMLHSRAAVSQLRLARWLSSVFRPEFFPVVGFVALFAFTYLSLLPWQFKVFVLSLVALGTIVLPRLTVRFWRRANRMERHLLRLRQNRFFPYLVYILYYAFTLHLLTRLHLPHYMRGIIVGSLLIQATCAFINLWWKISLHAAGAGGVVGALMAYSLIFGFNPLWWLSLCILIAGLVGTSRMLLRQHSLMQVVAGSVAGAVLGFAGIMLS